VTRVLVVDDNRDIVITLMAFLRTDGYATRGAFDGPEALRAVEEFRPDALIVDIAMPGMTGWEVARTLRQRDGGPCPMLIAISGEYEIAANKLLREKGGFDYCLSKPCDPNVVLDLLRPLKSSRA
jgi:CheY-like chemotaxis protein